MKKFNVIVYQMGKVASTSLVETLGALPHVSAFQSHFLGIPNLYRIVDNLINCNINEHFSHHGEGQLLHNIRLTRLIDCHRHNKADAELIIISCAREPVDWFRAQLVQEFDGYIDDFHRLAGIQATEDSSEEAVKTSLRIIRTALGRILEQCDPDAPDCINAIWSKKNEFTGKYGDSADFLIKQMVTFFRPILWFDTHILANFNIDIFQYSLDNFFFEYTGNYFTFSVFPFERLSAVRNKVFQLVESKVHNITRRNLSGSKPCADIFKNEIDKWKDYPSIQRIYESRYCRFFGYNC